MKILLLKILNDEIDENLFFTLLNIIDQDNKYLIVTYKKTYC